MCPIPIPYRYFSFVSHIETEDYFVRKEVRSYFDERSSYMLPNVYF